MITRKSSRGSADSGRPAAVYCLHGPDRVPVLAGAQAGWPSGYRPFHGIISRGMIQALQEAGLRVNWTEVCASLDAALAGREWQFPPLAPRLLELARSCAVLSFEDSMKAALDFVRQQLPNLSEKIKTMPCELENVQTVELWNVKEGHTSSVWKVTLLTAQGQPATSFALNVARDAAAGEELLSSAVTLEVLASRVTSARVSRIYLATRLYALHDQLPGIAAVAQEWIDEAWELGFLKDRTVGCHRLYAIDRFLTAPNDPGRIVSVAGRHLKEHEQEEILLQILLATLEGAVVDAESQRITFPSYELNEGDWVLSQDCACLVAASASWEAVDLQNALEYFSNFLPTKYNVENLQQRVRLQRLAQQAVQSSLERNASMAHLLWAKQGA